MSVNVPTFTWPATLERWFQSRGTLVGANGYANLFDKRFAILSHRVVHHDDPQMVGRLAAKARRGFRVGDDDVGAESFHHAQRVFDSAARCYRKTELGENCLRLRDDSVAVADEENEWRKTARICAASSATGQSAAVGYTSEIRCLCHGCRS
jgi:hypothetical protein